MATTSYFCGWEDHKTTKNVFGFDKNYMKERVYRIGLTKAIDNAPQVPVQYQGSTVLNSCIFGKRVQDKLCYVRKTLTPFVMIAGGYPAHCMGHKEKFGDIDVFCGICRSSPKEFDKWCEWFEDQYADDMEDDNLDLGEYMGWYNGGIYQKETHYSKWAKRGKGRYFHVCTLQEGDLPKVQLICWYMDENDPNWMLFKRNPEDQDELAARYRYFVHSVLSGFDIATCRVTYLVDLKEEVQEDKMQHFNMLRLSYIPSQPLTYMGEYAFAPCRKERKKYERALEYMKEHRPNRHFKSPKEISEHGRNLMYINGRLASLRRNLLRYRKYLRDTQRNLRRRELGIRPLSTAFVHQPKSLIECATSSILFYNNPPPYNSQHKLKMTQEYIAYLGSRNTPLPHCSKFVCCPMDNRTTDYDWSRNFYTPIL